MYVMRHLIAELGPLLYSFWIEVLFLNVSRKSLYAYAYLNIE